MITTTVIGSFPKPSYLPIKDWFSDTTADPLANSIHKFVDPLHQYYLLKATQEIVKLQQNLDTVTDGEVRRYNYIFYHCRHLDGIDFTNLKNKEVRNGAYQCQSPVIISKIKVNTHFLARDFLIASLFSDKPVKVTIPGPLTIMDSLFNDFYSDKEELMKDISIALNSEIKDLINHGCKYIQIDEPVAIRKAEDFLLYGIRFLNETLKGTEGTVERTVHICCGYTPVADNVEYSRADNKNFLKIVTELDNSPEVDVLALEDAALHNDLALFKQIKKSKLCLGVVASVRTRIESVQEICQRIKDVTEVFPSQKLIVSPDCGLGLLSRDQSLRKLNNMVQAVEIINNDIVDMDIN